MSNAAKNDVVLLLLYLGLFLFNPIHAFAVEITQSRSIEVISSGVAELKSKNQKSNANNTSITLDVRVKNRDLRALLQAEPTFIFSEDDPNFAIIESSESFLIQDDKDTLLASFSLNEPQALVEVLTLYVWVKNMALKSPQASSVISARFENANIGRLFLSNKTEIYRVRNHKPVFLLVLSVAPTGQLNILFPVDESETRLVPKNSVISFPISVDPMSFSGGEQILSVAVPSPTQAWFSFFSGSFPVLFHSNSPEMLRFKLLIEEQVDFSIFLQEIISVKQ